MNRKEHTLLPTKKEQKSSPAGWNDPIHRIEALGGRGNIWYRCAPQNTGPNTRRSSLIVLSNEHVETHGPDK